MRKLCIVCFLIFISFYAFGQNAGKVSGVETEAVNKIGTVPMISVSKIGNVNTPVFNKNCKEILQNYPGSSDGIYTIDPDGSGPEAPISCFCDMTTDGGGWTLVLLSNKEVAGCPRPYWNEVVNNVNINGTFSSDLTSFDLFLGVKYWNMIGNNARLDMGASPKNLSHRAYYNFSLNQNNYYSLVMSNESVTIHTEGTASPGMYTYHNGRPLSTRDADHDVYTIGNCSNNAGNSAWWFGACWSGSFWGGGGQAFEDAPYWNGSSTEYFNYGSIWLR